MNFIQILDFFYQILKPYRIWYFLMIMVPIFNSFCILFFNFSLKLIIDIFSAKNKIFFSEILKPILIFSFAMILREFFWRLRNYSRLKSDPLLKRDLFIKIYKITTKHSFTFFQNNLSGLIVSKMKGVCDGFFHIWDHLSTATLVSLMSIIISGFSLLFINKNIFFGILLFGLIFIPICFKIFSRISFLNQIEQEDYHKIIGFLGDRINNIFTIFHCASNNREIEFLRKHYNESNIPKATKNLKFEFKANILLSVSYLIFFISIFLYLIYLKNQNLITMGDIAFVMTMVFAFIDNIFTFMGEISAVIKHYSDLRSSMTLILQKEEITEFEKNYQINIHKNEDKQLEHLNHLKLENFDFTTGQIEYKNISFGYENNKRIFEDFNLTINPGEKIAFVGRSGAGKSTLVSLLLKNFFPQSGNIFIDQTSIYDINTYHLRNQISFIPQEINLFHRSILENVTYSKPNVSLDKVKDVLRHVDLLETINSLPHSFETMVGERGLKLSGGQKQRIAIARALLKESPIIIIDEATSNLDLETENDIKKAIDNLYYNKKVTMIIIAHRLSTIKNVDRIIMIQDGRIIESGNFNELISIENGSFRKMWESQ